MALIARPRQPEDLAPSGLYSHHTFIHSLYHYPGSKRANLRLQMLMLGLEITRRQKPVTPTKALETSMEQINSIRLGAWDEAMHKSASTLSCIAVRAIRCTIG